MQKQPSISFLRKRCSKNMQQIYPKTPMLKCDFNRVALQRKATLLKPHFGIGIFPVNLLHFFRTPVPKNIPGGLRLFINVVFGYIW